MADPDFFSHAEITGVLSDLNPHQPFMLNFFGREHLSNDKKIYFDKLVKDLRIAVFISPNIPGKARKKKGFEVQAYEPGYIKEKDLILPDHVFTRRPGEPMATPMTPAQRYQATVVDLSLDQKMRLDRRLEWMATQLLLAGQYRMQGEGLDVTVNLGRNAGNTVTLTSGDRWLAANTTVKPWKNLETWLNLCQAPVKTLVMGNASWDFLKSDAEYEKMAYLNALQGKSDYSIEIQKQVPEGATYRGRVQGTDTDIWTYTGTYADPVSGADTLYVPTDAVIGIPDSMYGFQCYGAIQDDEAGYMSMPYFYKNWSEKDPGIPILMMQSAPMLAHTKINSTFGVRTGATL